MADGSTTPAVAVEGLSKSFGPVPALREVSFRVPRGGVFAYLGPNGAGKTTTINLMCGLLSPDAGSIQVCGLDVGRDPVKVKERVGVVPDESNLYGELTCRRNLDYLGELYGLPRKARKQRTAELLAMFGLADRADMPFRALSRGLKRRLVLAAALVHSPEVLFLDEPTIGLDVPSARALRDLIRDINQQGATIFLTTHNLVEAEALADTVGILIKGGLAAVGSPDDLRRKVEQGTFLKLDLSGRVGQSELLAACPAVREAVGGEGHWRLKVEGLHPALRQVMALAESRELIIQDVAVDRPTLEQAFLAYVRQDPAPEAERK